MIVGVRRAARRFAAHRGAMIGAAIAMVLVVVAGFGPSLLTKDPLAADVEHGLTVRGAPLPPSSQALLGTDQLGRDEAARAVAATASSLWIAAMATLISLVIGMAIGITAGYAGGVVDSALMRLVDLMLAFPFVLIAILLAALFREADLVSSDAPVYLTLGVVSWTAMARIIRAKTRVLARSDMIVAARAIGASPLRIVIGYLVPSLGGAAIAVLAAGFAQNLLAEAVLSFLGLGPPPPAPTWGRMLAEGRAYYRIAPHLVLVPGAAILIAVAAFHLIGDGLRDALDTREEPAA